MNVASYSSQVYQTNKATATRATSAYHNSVASSQPVDKMDVMKEEYKDVYVPLPAYYSKERENLQLEKIKEKYPNYLSIEEVIKKYAVVASDIGSSPTAEQKELIEEKNIQFIKDHGGEEALKKEKEYISNIRNKYPLGWAREDFTPSNNKELSNFYNAAVYEGLEHGESLEVATNNAGWAINSYMNLAEVNEFSSERMMPMFKHSADLLVKNGLSESRPDLSEREINEATTTMQQHDIGQGDTIDLRKYGFNMEWNYADINQTNQGMVSILENRIDMYKFMLGNPDIVDSEFNKLGTSAGREGSNTILKTIEERFMPNTQRALDVFSQYKIYDSIDTKV